MRFFNGIAGFALMGAMAAAAPVIVFNSTTSGGHSGSISYTPPGTATGYAAVGTNIDIDSLVGTDTVRHNGSPATKCFSCLLSFTTGANISDTSVNGTTWSFGGGGTFKVFGGFDLNQNGIMDAGDIPAGTLLLTGVFNAPVTVTTPGPGPDLKFTSATLVNIMDNRLDGFFGTPGTSVYDGLYSQSFVSTRARMSNVSTNPNYNRFRFATFVPKTGSGMRDGTIVNTLVVPEPVSLLLFGTTGFALALVAARRRRQTQA